MLFINLNQQDSLAFEFSYHANVNDHYGNGVDTCERHLGVNILTIGCQCQSKELSIGKNSFK